MNPFTDQIAQAIGDPGSITARLPDETVTRWCGRAVQELLATAIGVDKEGHYAGTPASRALMMHAELRGRLRAAESVLADYADGEPCALDHEGYCQNHGLSDTTLKPCRNVRAHRVLEAALAKSEGVRWERDELAAEMALRETALARAEGAAQRYREAFDHGVIDRRRLIGELRHLDAVNGKQRDFIVQMLDTMGQLAPTHIPVQLDDPDFGATLVVELRQHMAVLAELCLSAVFPGALPPEEIHAAVRRAAELGCDVSHLGSDFGNNADAQQAGGYDDPEGDRP